MNIRFQFYCLLAATPRRRGVKVASRLWLCIFNKIGKQSLHDCDLTTLYIFNKMGEQSLRFATVALHILQNDCITKMTAYNWRLRRTEC